MARAYVQGDLVDARASTPGDPYDALRLSMSRLTFRRPTPAEAAQLLRALGLGPPGAAAPAAAGGAAALAAAARGRAAQPGP